MSVPRGKERGQGEGERRGVGQEKDVGGSRGMSGETYLALCNVQHN